MKKPINLCRKTKICKHNLGIPRSKMPQIEDDSIRDFLKYIKKSHSIKKQRFPVSKLKATQNQLSLKAIRKKQKKIKQGNYNTSPILISKDNYILDGHHRWASLRDCEMNPKNCNTNRKFKIKVFKIDSPIKPLLKKTKKFKGVKFSRIY